MPSYLDQAQPVEGPPQVPPGGAVPERQPPGGFAPGGPPPGGTMAGGAPLVPQTGLAPGMDLSARGGANPADVPPEIQEKVITLGAKAKRKIYEDPKNFENMMQVLEMAGKEGFPQAASTVVNTVLDAVEAEEGPQPEDVLAAAGAIVLGTISEDLSMGGALEVTPDMFNKAGAKAMQDWMANHPERVDQQGVIQELAAAGQQPGAAPPGQPPGPPNPAPGQNAGLPPGGSYLGGAP